MKAGAIRLVLRRLIIVKGRKSAVCSTDSRVRRAILGWVV